MKSIKWYQSKTVIVNILALLLTIIPEVTGVFHFGEQGLKVIGVIVVVINLALRLFSTDKAIEGTNAPSRP